MRKMRAVLLGLWLASVIVASCGDDTDSFNQINNDSKLKQIFILKLLNHVLQPVMYNEIRNIGRRFNIEDNINMFHRPDVVYEFKNMIASGTLPQSEIFTLHVDRQLKEVMNMFHVLYYAKDFSSFIKTACWMRLNSNEGMFIYALTVAVRHREDCKGIILPPPYEIYPYYFVRADVIQKAYFTKMRNGLLDTKLCEFYGIKKTDEGFFVIDENVFDKRVDLNDEDRLRYFTEDIDLNTYYYYFHVDYPFWMKNQIFDKTKTRRFEVTLYMYQQILARFYLERLSNGLDNIPTLSWNKPITKGYWTWMIFHNGVQFPMRFNNQYFVQDGDVSAVNLDETYENIIRMAIFKGFIEVDGVRLKLTKHDDIETLGRIIYGKVQKTDLEVNQVAAYRYLLIIMKSVLGLNTITSDNYFVVPSILDSYQTALRDPIFYQLQKRLIDLVILFKKRLSSYTREELNFPGIKIEHIVVDKLITYFDDYLMDMSNAVMLTEDELKRTRSDMTILVRKHRLNNQPFTITLEIASDKVVDSVVRIFLGPKRDNLGRLLDINTNRNNFVELDSFIQRLSTGKNTIVRNSVDMHNIVRDRVWTRDLWEKIEALNDTRDLLMKDLRNLHTGFPVRLILPKGTIGGMPMMLFCIVTPMKPIDNVDIGILDQKTKAFSVNFRSTVLLDKMPLGFPLDREIDEAKFFVPNMKFLDVIVFHKNQSCDMQTRWNKYVLRNYNMVGRNFVEFDNNYVGTNVNTKNKNVY